MKAHLERRYWVYLFGAVPIALWLLGFSAGTRWIVGVAMLLTMYTYDHFAMRPLREAVEREYMNGIQHGRAAMYGEIMSRLNERDPDAMRHIHEQIEV